MLQYSFHAKIFFLLNIILCYFVGECYKGRERADTRGREDELDWDEGCEIHKESIKRFFGFFLKK